MRNIIRGVSYASISPIKFIECLADAGAPKGIVNIVTSSARNVDEALVTHLLIILELLDKICTRTYSLLFNNSRTELPYILNL